MNLSLPLDLVSRYHNASQIARVATEAWAQTNLRCPRCGGDLAACAANTRTKDFDCSLCDEHFQLKSGTKKHAGKLIGAEYRTTLASIQSGCHPSLILLRYSRPEMTVLHVQFVHKACITSRCLVPREPLSPRARRAGWQGCMLDLGKVSDTGRVDAVRNGEFVTPAEVAAQWAIADRLLREPAEFRGWTADVFRIVERLPTQFRLSDIYKFADELAVNYPNNRHIRPKIRQQLQVLRDLGLIAFADRPGAYRRVSQKAASRPAVQ